MRNILNFAKWILSESIKTPHFEERRADRLLGNPQIMFPSIITNKFDEETLQEMEKEAKKKIVDEFDRRVDDLLKKDFDLSTLTAYPLMSTFVSYMDKKYPLNLKVEGERNYMGDKVEYFGNQIYIPISLNTLRTIKIYKDDFTEDQIDLKNRWHFSNNPDIYRKKEKAKLEYQETPIDEAEYEYVIIATPSGTIRNIGEEQTVRGKGGTQGKSNKVYTCSLSPGRKIKFKTKLESLSHEGGYAIGEIEKIENAYTDPKTKKRGIKGDKVRLSLMLKNPKGGNDIRMMKEFGYGDQLYLILPKEENFTRLEVTKPIIVAQAGNLKEPLALRCKIAY